MDGQVRDKVTKECRPPLKRGRKSSGRFSATAKKTCPDGQVRDKVTKECRPPLKRGRTSNRTSPKVEKNETLDKYGFAVPVFRDKVYADAKTYKQTTLAFSKPKP
jgi:hypothetical protein